MLTEYRTIPLADIGESPRNPQRYAPKPAAPEKKKATKVRTKRENAEAT